MAEHSRDRGLTVSYVPNELCLVVDEPPNEVPGERVYQQVLARLNAYLASCPTGGRARDQLEADLKPSLAMTRLLRGTQRLLEPIEAKDGRLGEGQQPWVTFERSDGLSRLLFYRLGGGVVGPQDERLPLLLEQVRQLTNLLNWRPPGLEAEMPGRRLAAAAPNWLTSGSHGRESPGTQPEPIRRPQRTPKPPQTLPKAGPGRYSFAFEPELAAAMAEWRKPRQDSERPASVAVAVLDTSPSPTAVVRAAKRYADNLLLAEVAAHPGQVVIAAPPSLPTNDFGHIAGYFPNWQELLPALRDGQLIGNQADHGLFVTGIIRDIAPQADIHLIRVLGDDGLGDLLSLVNTLRQLPERLAGYRRLVVNLSLTIDMPPGEQLLRQWLPRTARSGLTLGRRWADLCPLLGRLHLGLGRAIEWLQHREVLVVAAAGNSAFGAANRPEPAYPAAYDSVLGVASVNRAVTPAFYSQRGDRLVFGNGVAIFGGEGIAADGDELPKIPPASGPFRDAVAGLFSGEQLPLTPPGVKTNETGWVWWSGTSFATPVISGLAANYWLADVGLAPGRLMEKIIGLASIDEATLEAAGGPFDCPAISAQQRYS